MWRLIAGPAVVLALAALAGVTSGHDHVKQHSHFCEGGGYDLFCNEAMTLKINKAWYGRLAHDDSCVGSTFGNETVTSTSPHSDLTQACGSSILDSKDTWCEKSINGGCTITVQDLGPDVDEVACPDTVNKYLYLEYECDGGSSSASTVMLDFQVVLLALLAVVGCYFGKGPLSLSG